MTENNDKMDKKILNGTTKKQIKIFNFVKGQELITFNLNKIK